MYYSSRYYDPAIGRFLSADTIVPDPSNAQAYNRYTYVYNSPIRYIDPTGHEPVKVWGICLWSCGGGKVHGNSKASTKPQHGYEIHDSKAGKVAKVGISGDKLNKDGSSPRANGQINKLNKDAGYKKYSSKVVKTDMPNRESALEWEKGHTEKLKKEGHKLKLQQRPNPNNPWGKKLGKIARKAGIIGVLLSVIHLAETHQRAEKNGVDFIGQMLIDNDLAVKQEIY